MYPGNLLIHSLNGNGIFPDFSFVHLGNLVSHLGWGSSLHLSSITMCVGFIRQDHHSKSKNWQGVNLKAILISFWLHGYTMAQICQNTMKCHAMMEQQ